ncbi:hypothetical protein NFI96_005696 [Prochilodus magdalenae]|nr:hypothetical protein NFI96_005696 [Prochilodus magdalenae]
MERYRWSDGEIQTERGRDTDGVMERYRGREGEIQRERGRDTDGERERYRRSDGEIQRERGRDTDGERERYRQSDRDTDGERERYRWREGEIRRELEVVCGLSPNLTNTIMTTAKVLPAPQPCSPLDRPLQSTLGYQQCRRRLPR